MSDYLQAIIFDMDGLMIDSEPIQSKAYEAVLKEYNVDPRYHSNGLIQILGMHTPGNWQSLKNKHHLDESVEVLIDKKNKAYDLLIGGDIEPMPGLLDLLDYARSKGMTMAVASSSSRQLINTILDKLAVREYFALVVSGEEVTHGKPAPDIFLEAAKRLKINPVNCLVLEDSENGVVAAKAADMKVIAVQNQYTEGQDHSKADAIVKSLANINKELLESLNTLSESTHE